MNYEETLQYINAIPKFAQILGNANLKQLLDQLGNPQDKLRFVHVAGTNGKGSVCAMLSAVFQKSGLKTGLFTSPFIETFNERIKINDENIPNDKLAKIATKVKNEIAHLNLEISAFAQITAMAFLFFLEEKCDIVVLETGLGGKLDATNVITTPIAVVITKIGLDHTEYLGETFSQIALEKCGIIKDGIPVITTENQEKSAMDMIVRESHLHNSPLCIAKNECNYELNLSGDYQKENASIVVTCAKTLELSDDDISYGLSHTKWIARFEYLTENLIIDGAHNPDGVSALLKSLEKLKKSVIFVVAMMQDKAYSESAKMINAFAKYVIVTELNMPRCLDSLTLSQNFDNPDIIPNPILAVESALRYCSKDELVCVCGSLYLAGEVRKHFT